MDLSSLEGPPILDTRFSNPASGANDIPHIRLEHVLSPVSPIETRRWDLPPRPASASAIPSRSKYPNTGSNGFWQSINPNENPASFSCSQQSQPLQPGASQATPTLSPTPSRSPRTHSNSVSAPHQLVWVESEQIWILTTRTAPSTSAPHQRSHSSHSSMFGSGRGGALSHSRSMDSYPITEFWGDPETDDLPPPYEQHVYDQPLGPILPAVTRVRPEDVPHRGSRWAAIGRRVS
ncbi:hypothetical protein BJY04DRAFT_219623 [Aspergillus karnatakaensis]|uniref:uncharacterized protein n=1 Tax=Aspergillus karnatakaensis TaxID=1810916 RepID=UPI003CCCDDC7